MLDDVGRESIGTRIMPNDTIHDVRVKPKLIDVGWETKETRRTWFLSNPLVKTLDKQF